MKPANIQLQAHYSMEKPAGSPDLGAPFQVPFLFPK